MNNLKSVILLIGIVLLGFSSCSRDDSGADLPKDETGKNVVISFSSGITSRAIDDPIDDGASAAVFEKGQLIFAKDNGVVTRVYVVGDTHDIENNLVSVTKLCDDSGVEFNGVFAEQIFVLGNKSFEHLNIGSNMFDLLANEDNVLKLADLGDGTYAKHVLFGSSPIVAINGDGEERYGANVVLKPVTARLEIREIKEVNSENHYTYVLEGIYINNYYQKLELKPPHLNGSNISSDKQLWMEPENLKTEFPGTSSALHNLLHYPEANSHTASADGEKVWSFSVFPAINNSLNEDNLPHIIIHIKDLKKNGTLIKHDYYLTGSRYGAITEFKGGYAYVLKTLNWDALTDGDDTIESNLIDVDMEVSVMDWIPKDVIIDIN